MALIVREYVDERGRNPYRRWLATRDTAIRARIQARILRFEMGNLGDHKEIDDGIWEARLTFGSGYRLYFHKVGRKDVLLLLGGDKKKQRKDIERAKNFWHRYLEETKHGKAE